MSVEHLRLNSRPRRSPDAVGSLGRPLAFLTPTRVAVVLALWAGWYAAYRLYYAFGGQAGMIGEPRSPAQFREINLVGGVVILIAALAPPIMALAWPRRRVRKLVVVAGWLGLVGCCTHAITDEILRVFSLTGAHPTRLSPQFWLSVDRHKADLQDILLNEPWFFIEGCLWGVFALIAAPGYARRKWLRSALIACALASTFGVLSGVGAIPRSHLG